MTKLSNTAVNLYNQCSYCYFLHYKQNVRPIKTSSALVFGSALDLALNKLLITKDLEKALQEFENCWYGYYKDPNIVYFKSDLDQELIDFKGGVAIFDEDDNWSSLLFKGLMFIQAYHKEVMPKIKKVFAVQEPISIKNNDGDEITGFLDLIVKWEDDKAYLMDNKSSANPYDVLSAKDGQQLPLYHYAVKHEYKLEGIGYIVLIKKINKNRIKKCTECGTVNNSSHKKCPEIIEYFTGTDGKIDKRTEKRCNGEFKTTINPTVDIQYVFNKVEESDENRVLELFDKTNNAISSEQFATEHNPVRGKYGYCPYKDYYEGSPDFYIKEKK
jgi:hypothetical protein